MMISFFKSTILRYIFSGGTAAAVNLGTTWILDRLGIYYLIVVSLAFILSLITSFTLQKYLTFRDADNTGVRRQFVSFTALGVVNLAVNDLLVYIQIDILHMPYLVIAQAVASIIIAIYSFFIYRVLFSRKQEIGN